MAKLRTAALAVCILFGLAAMAAEPGNDNPGASRPAPTPGNHNPGVGRNTPPTPGGNNPAAGRTPTRTPGADNPAVKTPDDTTTTTEPEANIGRLNDWYRTSNLAEIRDGEFYLDSLSAKAPISVFRRDQSYYNTNASLNFKLDRTGTGDRAVGLIFGSTDGQNYYSLHITRREVALCRVVNGQRIVLDKRGNLDKAEDQWYTARVECEGQLVRVFFGDRFLFANQATDLKPGYVGFYADEGRAHIRRLDFDGKQVRLDTKWQLGSR